MRHSISGRKLNRTSSHRKALFKNLSNSLIINEQIKTTLPKAKDLKPFVEKIITLGKTDTLHSKRKVFSILRSNQSVNKVFNILSKNLNNYEIMIKIWKCKLFLTSLFFVFLVYCFMFLLFHK